MQESTSLECGNNFIDYDKVVIRPAISVIEIKLEENEKLISLRSSSGKLN